MSKAKAPPAAAAEPPFAWEAADGVGTITLSRPEVLNALTFEVSVAGRHPTARLDRLRDRIEALDGRLTVDEGKLGSRVQGWLPLSR